MKVREERGFTLVELLIALAIVASLLAIAFGGLRVALGAWRQGETSAETHQHVRGIAVTLARSIGAIYPFQGPLGLSPQSVLLFTGTESSLSFVTETPPFPFQIPIAFTAVVIALEGGDEPGLVVKTRPLPNRDPFTQAKVVLRDPSVTKLTFRYMDKSGGWKDAWNTETDTDKTLPYAVQMTVTANLAGRTDTIPPMTVPIRSVGQ